MKNKIKILFLGTLLLFVFPKMALGFSYYVDKENKFGNSCSNSWPGSVEQPKCDFNHTWFQHGLEPGDEVMVREAPSAGYGEIRLYLDSSGSSENPISIKGYGTEKIELRAGLQFGVRLVGDVSYVTFEDLKISGREYSFAAEAQTAGNYGIKLKDCEIYNMQHGPRFFNFHDSEIRNCEVHDLTVNGVQFRDSTNIVVDSVNVVRVNDGRSPDNSDADGFHTYGGENLVISNSTSSYNAEDGFDLNANATLINIKSYHNNGGGLKVWRRVNDSWADKTVTVINSVFNNNGYYEPNPLEGNPGVKISDGAGLNLYNSVVYENYDQGVQSRWATDDGSYLAGKKYLPIIIKNTIIANTINGPGLNDTYRCTLDTLNVQENPACTSVDHLTTESNNLYFNNFGGDAKGYNLSGTYSNFPLSNPILLNPNFINPSSDNFNIQSDSPAIDEGVDLGGLGINALLVDMIGIARPKNLIWDIGAYEYDPGSPSDETPPSAPIGLNVL